MAHWVSSWAWLSAGASDGQWLSGSLLRVRNDGIIADRKIAEAGEPRWIQLSIAYVHNHIGRRQIPGILAGQLT